MLTLKQAFTTRMEWNHLNNEGLGYVVQGVLYPRGFADFVLVLFVLSGINVNVIVSSHLTTSGISSR